MPEAALQIFAVHGVGEVRPGDVLVDVLVGALTAPDGPGLRDGDVLVVTSKVVSKAEGRLVAVDDEDPASKVELVEGESVRVLRRRGDLRVTETAHGFVCANAGVDLSNVAMGTAVLLPIDPDRSARRLRADLGRRLGVEVGVIVSDTFGRAWRRGVTDVAIGCAGVAGVVDLRGTPDAMGRVLEATEVCVVDELAAAADVVMGKAASIPAVVVRGAPSSWLREGSVGVEVVRPYDEDLFR
jgi:coenzyme F420-0:L-glutamate ligase / coenzyme F420-1:gamma-L-glutamate ligase